MIELPNLRPETRHGMPAADRYLFNRQYIIGYAYMFRQVRWAMELIDSDTMKMESVGAVESHSRSPLSSLNLKMRI